MPGMDVVVGALLVVLLLLAFAGLAFSWWDVRRERGRRFLTRWGVSEPTEQADTAARYLRHRRLLHPFVFSALLVGVNVMTGVNGLPDPDWGLVLLGALHATLLVAEVVVAVRRRLEPVRVASLARRRFTDVVPSFALALQAAMTLVLVAAAGVALAVQPWADSVGAWRRRHDDEIGPSSPIGILEWDPPPQGTTVIWLLLGIGLAVALAAFAVVRLTLTRGPVADDVVDAALRVRTARVAVGTGLLLTAVPLVGIVSRIGEVGVLASIASQSRGWPPRLLPTPDFPGPPAWIAEVGELRDTVVLLAIATGLVGWAAVVAPVKRLRLVQANR
ncbi:hypothetical protein [Actinopolymorpha sp. B9G3]|uniref:hypothetical protein n=1 Tax=Actinopolymorpha sp. B9G3 TaxID=3158970 RepID=UPI0032D8BD4F